MRAVVAAVAATALCAGPAEAADYANPPWPNLLPPFPVAKKNQPGPIPHCKRGRINCVTSTMKRMQRKVTDLGCDHRAVFATTYLTLTRILRGYIRRRDFFDDRRYLSFQVTGFANYYFRTLRRLDRGQPIPAAWRIAMDAAMNGDTNAAQDMLAGINAHVQRDMPYVVAELGLVTPGNRSRKPDHDRGNEVLNEAYQPVVDAIRERYDPILATTNPTGVIADDALGMEMVKSWREGVWRNAERLVNASTPEEYQRVVDSIETNAATSARMIVTPQQPGYRAQRDAYCQSRLGR
jgi:hypothetical protein